MRSTAAETMKRGGLRGTMVVLPLGLHYTLLFLGMVFLFGVPFAIAEGVLFLPFAIPVWLVYVVGLAVAVAGGVWMHRTWSLTILEQSKDAIVSRQERRKHTNGTRSN